MARARVAVVAALALLTACASPGSVGPRLVGFGEPPHPIGALHVWIRPQPEVEVLCRMAQPALPRTHRILGCYIEETHTIIAIEDPWVILHEMKHVFEGHWHAEPGAP